MVGVRALTTCRETAFNFAMNSRCNGDTAFATCSKPNPAASRIYTTGLPPHSLPTAFASLLRLIP